MRPLVMFTWWAEFYVFGQNPIVSHAINVALYFCNVLLVRALALRMLRLREYERPMLWATLAGLMYAVHPVLIESTAWVSGRFDLVCTLCLLGATVIFVHYRAPTPRRLVLVMLLFALALLSKELGVVSPAIFFCFWLAGYADQSKSLSHNIRDLLVAHRWTWISCALVLGIYFVARKFTVGGVYGGEWGLGYYIELTKTLLPLKALVMYTMLTLLPFGRVGIMHPISANPADLLFFLYAILAIGLIAVVIFQAAFRQRAWAWVAVAGYISLTLVLHFIPMLINVNIIQDRFLTAPLAFFCIAIVFWINEAGLTKRVMELTPLVGAAAGVLLSAWLLFSAVVVISIAPLWKSPFSVWAWTYKNYPEIEVIRHNYLEAAISEGHTDLARAEFERLLVKRGGLEVSEQILYGNLLLRSGDAEVIPYLEGVFYALPKFHLDPDGHRRVESHILTSRQVASAYTSYALGKLLFDQDVATAMEYNDIARWYMSGGAEVFTDYTRAAIMYCAGRIDEADRLMGDLDPIYHYDKEGLKLLVPNVVRAYCDNTIAASEGVVPAACLELESRGFFRTIAE